VTRDTAIVGIGMTRFGKYPDRSLKSLGAEAVTAALDDAGLEVGDIDMAFVANSMAAITTGQAAVVGQTVLRDQGFAGIPVFNIDNACAGSSSALSLAVMAIRSGSAKAVLVLGVEKLITADRAQAFRAINGAVAPDLLAESGIDPGTQSVFVASIYPQRLAAYASRHALAAETLADISVKNRAAAALNPLAQYTEPLTREDVLNSRNIVGPITALMCAPMGDGAAAVVVVAADRVSKSQRPVWIGAAAVGMGSPPGAESSIARVSARAYAQAGLTARDIHLAELHDSIAFNELLAYEELGFAAAGEGSRLVAEGATSLGGRIPSNTSGGLESRGHPIAATGLGQIFEIVTQLRGDAGARQVRGARTGLAENAGGYALDDTAAMAITILQA
jgi:acetyl-CoA acetyltransferase